MVDKKGSLNIWKIFSGDIKKIRNNTMAWIVILGLTIVPSLYAWFNIAASWDPYANTGNLKVAVASVDEGYSGELTAINLNIGDKVISALRENDALDWVFTTEKEAIQGVKDGSYYAALVIPKSFSRDMMSFFTPNVHRSDILYYLNEKKNAIAPKITNKGASAVKSQIDEIFAKSITEVALEVTESLSNVLEKGDADRYINNFLGNFESVGTEISKSGDTVESFAKLTESLAGVTNTAAELTAQMTENAGKNQALLAEGTDRINDAAQKLQDVSASLGQTLDKVTSFYDSIAKKLDEIIELLNEDADAAIKKLRELEQKVNKVTQTLITLRSGLEEIDEQIPEEQAVLKTAVEKLAAHTDELIEKQQDFAAAIGIAADKIQSAITKINDAQVVCRHLRSDVDIIRSEYENEVEPRILALCSAMTETNSALSEVLDNIDLLAADLETDTASAVLNLTDTAEALHSAAETMKAQGKKISAKAEDFRKALQSGDSEKMRELLGSDAQTVSAFLSAPVDLDTTAMYPVENYGSAMAPFYSVLAIWVGAIVLVAMLKVTLDEERKRELEDLKNHQMYLGRMIFFLIMGLLQSGLVCLGDLFFLEIQCEHPLYFMLAGWITGIVFTIIMYTLTVSFGDVGKAVAVVLLVIQVAGSGGTFPIEMTPQFFQSVYKLLPFTHAMTAMRECIAGFYENTYWTSMGHLGIYVIIFLFIGLVLRKPIIRLNDKFTEKLESTKLM